MRKYILGCLLVMVSTFVYPQTNNPISIYEGERINTIEFVFKNLPADTLLATPMMQKVEYAFRLTPQSQFSSFLSSYYLSQVKRLLFVAGATVDLESSPENGVDITVMVNINSVISESAKRENVFKNPESFPVIYNDGRTFLNTTFAATEMVYSNNNAWFAQPKEMNNGNPLAEKPSGEGYTAWLEGFASAGVYGITNVIPSINLHIYGGASYLVSFSAGNELFTERARIYGGVEEAFVGFIGGGRTASGNIYRYNTLYGRKQFTLGDGWLIVNTSMNGQDRAALQLNPRWASRHVFQTGFMWNNLFIQGFRLQADELPTLNSATTINGINFEAGNKALLLFGGSFLAVPHSRFKYYAPSGDVYSRQGLQVYNLRIFKSSNFEKGGLFFKLEGGYQRNNNFDMSAWAYYAEIGWSFARTKGAPTISYRYAYFSGDDPDTKSFNRWDALYTGGNGEQWVQGSNMYKIVQNSNEISHRLQAVYSPLRKIQLVGQVWLFYAPQKVNIGGNPALTYLKSKYYGSEYNLTIKYFRSRNWYFHLNTAYTLAGTAITDNVSNTKNWFCLSAFARYSF